MTTSTPHCSSSNGNTSNAVNTTSSSSSGSSLKADNNHRATTLYNGNSPGATSTTTATATAAAAAANIGSTNRVMQADEDFNIRFVNLVRTHRCLYDKKVPEYRNRDNQEKAWALISEDTRESVIHCKERWRNLRACLSRYIKQQSGSEPQHKPYYLTEHMAFLLPFLKSTRNSLDGNNSLASLYKFSQQHLHFQQQQQHQQHQQEHLYCNNNNNTIGLKNESAMELKQSLSENDDEETIDAFDPAIAAQLALQHRATTPGLNAPGSPVHSDTASANSLQNFIPDVQLAESGQDLIYNDSCSTPHFHNHSLHNHIQQQQQQQHQQQQQQQQQQSPCSAKRIKTECEATSSGYFGNLSVTEHTDMEFFRSILPDIAALTPQQRRKFKIGILELIDDVVERYPNHGVLNGSAGSSSTASIGGNRQQRRSSGRDWRK